MQQKIEEKILEITEQCVRCGMCLPDCPTNKLTNLEGHSPRGRIALWQNLAEHKLDLTPTTQDYLNHCLSCGACANNCPAGVEFLELQDLGKYYLNTLSSPSPSPQNNIKANIKSQTKLSTTLLIKIFSSKKLTTLLAISIYTYQKLKIHTVTELLVKILNKTSSKQNANKLIKYINQLNTLYKNTPKLTSPFNNSRSSITPGSIQNKSITNVLLFTGCVNKIAGQNKITSAINILNKLGINVHISKDLHCCGAMYKHNGLLDEYEKLAKSNLSNTKSLIDNNKIDKILTIDTGCHPEINNQFTKITQNIELFILNQLKQQAIPNNPNNKIKCIDNPIYIYTPCSQREQLKTPNLTKDLLNLFSEQINIKQVPKGYGCCGAAGTYMFEHPETSNKLAKAIIDDLLAQAPEFQSDKTPIICTSNIGCSMQLKNTMFTDYGINIEILSPLEIIDKILA